jgi:hypothetical protein
VFRVHNVDLLKKLGLQHGKYVFEGQPKGDWGENQPFWPDLPAAEHTCEFIAGKKYRQQKYYRPANVMGTSAGNHNPSPPRWWQYVHRVLYRRLIAFSTINCNLITIMKFVIFFKFH